MWAGLGTSLADFSGRRVHNIDPYMVTYYDCIRVDFMYVGMAWVRPWLDCSRRRLHKIDPYMVTYYDCVRVNFM